MCEGVACMITDILFLPVGQSSSEESNNTWYQILFYEATSNCCICKYSKLKYILKSYTYAYLSHSTGKEAN